MFPFSSCFILLIDRGTGDAINPGHSDNKKSTFSLAVFLMHFFYSRIEPLFSVLSRKQLGIILIIPHGFSHRILSAEFKQQIANIKQRRAWERGGGVDHSQDAQDADHPFKLYMYGWSSNA